MRPLFVSFTGYLKGKSAMGYVVCQCIALTKPAHIEELCRDLEKKRGYDADSIVILGFRRLEAEGD